MIKLLIFDLDGTLVDSAPDIVASAQLLRTRHKLPNLPDKTIISYIGNGSRMLVTRLFPHEAENPAQITRLTEEFFGIYEQNLVVKTTPMPGILEFLDQHAHAYQIALVTNKHEHLTRLMIEKMPFARYNWACLFGGDSLARQKPDPLPLLETLQRLGVSKNEAVMIGDGLPDMQAAKAAGLRAIGLEFGYTPPGLLKEAGATLLLKSFHQLKETLEHLDQRGG